MPPRSGCWGLNGSGKSTLLRIIAGVDKEFNGETILSSGYTIGFLEQEPQLDPNKTVKEIVQEGAQEAADLLAEFNRINDKFAEPMSEGNMNKLIERQGRCRRGSRPSTPGTWIPAWKWPWTPSAALPGKHL